MAHILIIDDDPDERALIIFALRFAGHKMISIEDFRDLSSQVKTAKPDLILLADNLLKINQNIDWQAFQVDIETAGIPIIRILDDEQETFAQEKLQALEDQLIRPITADAVTIHVNDLLKKGKKS